MKKIFFGMFLLAMSLFILGCASDNNSAEIKVKEIRITNDYGTEENVTLRFILTESELTRGFIQGGRSQNFSVSSDEFKKIANSKDIKPFLSLNEIYSGDEEYLYNFTKEDGKGGIEFHSSRLSTYGVTLITEEGIERTVYCKYVMNENLKIICPVAVTNIINAVEELYCQKIDGSLRDSPGDVVSQCSTVE
ncbi:MAG: hypothetical protein HYS32_00200 [Candidatus Woesearchaeota archaeon]|nr:MAG: hypothetical protein HYS32_00200 [Candidatus Woesearchaeota archaeon]